MKISKRRRLYTPQIDFRCRGKNNLSNYSVVAKKIENFKKKITAKNAWKLQIIDILKPLCQKSRQDILQVASTSIDISARVYSVRVDDVHSEGLKLANNMARVAEASNPVDNDDQDQSDNEEGRVSTKKKKRRRVHTGVKSTINKNPKGNVGKLSRLEPTDFTTRIHADSGTIDNLFTSKLKETSNSFILLERTKKFFEEFDPIVRNEEFVSLNNIKLSEKVTSINPSLVDFMVDVWDPDQEDKQLNAEKSMLSQLQPLVYDDNGYPIPELDGSVHELFEQNDADDMDNDDDVQVMEFQQANLGASDVRGTIAHVIDFRPNETCMRQSEYSFNPVIRTSNGKYIDQIWAGPSHWKLKFIRRSTQRFSGQVITTAKAAQKGRKRNQAEMIDFSGKLPEIDLSKKVIIKKRPPAIDIDKITLPLMDQSCARIVATVKELMLKSGVCPVEKINKTVGENGEEYEVSPYKYENPNDSLYCSQSQPLNDDCDNGGDDNMDGIEEHGIPHAGNLAEHLVDNPEMVLNTYIQYATKAKQIDMKKLKSAVWYILTGDEKQSSDKVIPRSFSDVYKALPDKLPSKERDKLSCSLAFFALLHLANEKSLYLKQLSADKDCFIMGSEYYTSGHC